MASPASSSCHILSSSTRLHPTKLGEHGGWTRFRQTLIKVLRTNRVAPDVNFRARNLGADMRGTKLHKAAGGGLPCNLSVDFIGSGVASGRHVCLGFGSKTAAMPERRM